MHLFVKKSFAGSQSTFSIASEIQHIASQAISILTLGVSSVGVYK